MKTYDISDLKEDRWLRKREKILSYADHQCQICGVSDMPLQVHHSYYRASLKAWEYPDGSLIAVCEDCHGRIIHGIETKPQELQMQDSGLTISQEVINILVSRFEGHGDDNQNFPSMFYNEPLHDYTIRVMEWFEHGIDDRFGMILSYGLVRSAISVAVKFAPIPMT